MFLQNGWIKAKDGHVLFFVITDYVSMRKGIFAYEHRLLVLNGEIFFDCIDVHIVFKSRQLSLARLKQYRRKSIS